MKRKMTQLGFTAICLVLVVSSGMAADRSTLEAVMEVEQALLTEDLRKMRNLSSDRTQVELQLRTMHSTLAAILGTTAEASVVQAELIFMQIEGAEANRRLIFEAQQNLVSRIIDRKRKLDLMGEQMDDAGSREEPDTGPLTGAWRVVLMPREQNGAFNLIQTGTLVSGTYTLAGGWSGSVQGTLVNRKVYLVRIDSKLGRSMELEGVLSGDGSTISGTWLNYDLGGEGGAQGQWSATRVDRDE
jgi:hypothetical protein